MFKHCQAAFFAAIFFAVIPIQAQDVSASLSSNPSLPSAPRTVVEEKVPFFSFAVGYTYLQTDLTNTPGATNSYLMGWYAMPQYHINKHFSVIGEETNFINWHAHSGENVHGFAGGPEYSFASVFHRVSPYVFAEGGALRDSRGGSVNWNPAAMGGFGMNVKLTRALAFQLIPGEYVAMKLPDGEWESNYTAKAGFVLTGFRMKHHRQ